jgi:hypothetical protein
MNLHLLIEAIVRQTTVLIAQLATVAGGRATLASTADQVFLSLVNELKQQGLSNKVIADMFGLALRTYHNRLQRLAESKSFEGRSVWETVYEFVREEGPVTRTQVLAKFFRDEPQQVRAVLADLVNSELLVRSGRGESTSFRVLSEEEVPASEAPPLERICCLLLVAIHRFGPLPVSELANVVPLTENDMSRALEQLLGDGRVRRAQDNPNLLVADNYLIPVGEPAGFEAAVFDHYQALVTALCVKLRGSQLRSLPDDWVGGSTYCYDIWPDHPLHAEVSGFLANSRRQAVALRQRVEAHNRAHPRPAEQPAQRFTAYVGQSVITEDTLPPSPDA